MRYRKFTGIERSKSYLSVTKLDNRQFVLNLAKVIFDKEQIDLVGADCIRPTARLRLSIKRDYHRVQGRMQSAPTDCGYIHQQKVSNRLG